MGRSDAALTYPARGSNDALPVDRAAGGLRQGFFASVGEVVMPDVTVIRSTWSELAPAAKISTLTVIALLAMSAWGYMVYMAWAMENMHRVDMWMPPRGGMRAWVAYDFFMLFSMWLVMMVAMMLPSAIPLALLFAKVQQGRRGKDRVAVPTWLLVAGYIGAWGVFSVAITLVQWQLHQRGLLDPMMGSRNYLFSGVMLLIAGVYQWTPWKDTCLKYCRTPMSFLLGSWREGNGGAFTMGTHHGMYCVLCCWGLMLVMFAVGVMNMLWMVIIALFVLLEKTVLPPRSGSMLVGSILLIWGGWYLALYWR